MLRFPMHQTLLCRKQQTLGAAERRNPSTFAHDDWPIGRQLPGNVGRIASLLHIHGHYHRSLLVRRSALPTATCFIHELCGRRWLGARLSSCVHAAPGPSLEVVSYCAPRVAQPDVAAPSALRFGVPHLRCLLCPPPLCLACLMGPTLAVVVCT